MIIFHFVDVIPFPQRHTGDRHRYVIVRSVCIEHASNTYKRKILFIILTPRIFHLPLLMTQFCTMPLSAYFIPRAFRKETAVANTESAKFKSATPLHQVIQFGQKLCQKKRKENSLSLPLRGESWKGTGNKFKPNVVSTNARNGLVEQKSANHDKYSEMLNQHLFFIFL